VRAGRSLRTFAERVRSSSRRVWLTSFVLVTVLCGLWAISQPVFAGPDEPSNVIRSTAVAHGQFTGSEPHRPVAGKLRRVEDSVRIVQAPAIYASIGAVPCFADHVDLLAPCLRFRGPIEDAGVATYAARQPPAYYAAVGLASWAHHASTATVYLMRLVSAVITGALLASAITAVHRSAAPLLLGVGLAVAITPMVLFLGGLVNPSGPEIAAALAFWVCSLVLVSRPGVRVDNTVAAGAGVAGCVLALSRQLGPLWLVLIAVAVLGMASREALRSLARSTWVRVWVGLIGASALAQVAWDLIVQPRDATLAGRAPSGLSWLEQVQDSFGQTFRWYREMIGWFGWLDNPAATLVWIPWTAALAFLVFVAMAWVRRRHAAVLVALLAAVVVVPVVVNATPYNADGTFWQGSYTLPLAAGVPIIAAFALAATERGRDLVNGRFVLVFGLVVGFGQFLAFAQDLRRYTVGVDGSLAYFQRPQWTPPLPPLLLTIAYAVAVIAFVAWLLGRPTADAPPL
jgi:hypothetical protein